MFLKNLLIGLLFAVCLVKICEGIKCYKCMSNRDTFCGEDNFSKGKNPDIIDCSMAQPPNNFQNPKAPTKCTKVVLKDNVGTIVKRDCHWERIGDSSPGCYYDHNLKMEKCETCTEDLCNSATKQFSTFGITAALMAFLKVLLY